MVMSTIQQWKLLKSYKTTIFFFVSLLLLTPLIDAALNIHRNFGEGLIASIKDHIYIDRSYTTERLNVSPTCSSMDGTLCSFLVHSDLGDIYARKTKKQLPILPRTSNYDTPLSGSRAVPIFETGFGDDSDSETFASTSGDAITWLVSRQSVFDEVWDMERLRMEVETSLDQLSSNSLESISDISDKIIGSTASSFKTQAPPAAPEQSISERWWDPRHWLKQLDRFADKLTDLILSDFDFDEEEDDEKEEDTNRNLIEAGSTEKQATGKEKPSRVSEDKPHPTAISWNRTSRSVDFTEVPFPTEPIPEFFGSSASPPFNVALRWIGNWKIDIPNVSQSDTPCANLASVNGFLLFSKPVIVSELSLIRVGLEDDKIQPSSNIPDTNAADTIPTNNILTPDGSEILNKVNGSSEVRSNQRVFFEGWFWNPSARREFIKILEEEGEPDSDAWFYSSAPLKAIESNSMTRVWSVEIDLQSEMEESDILNNSFLWDRTGARQEILNIIERISGTPYLRIDGISIRFGVGSTENLVVKDKEGHVEGFRFSRSPGSFPNISGSMVPTPKQLGRRTVIPNSRLANSTGICVQRILMHRPVAIFNDSAQKPEAVEATAVVPGVIIREISYDSNVHRQTPDSDEVDKMNKRVIKNPKVLDLEDRKRYIESSILLATQQQQKYQANGSTQLSTPAPPFGRPVPPRMIPVAAISSDGVVLSQDWRPPIQQVQVILQQNMPIESPVWSLSELHELDEVPSRKPSPSTEVSFNAVSIRVEHPGPLGQANGNEMADIRQLLQNTAEGEPEMSDTSRGELTLLKRKLMEAAKSALQSARRSHEMSSQTRRLQGSSEDDQNFGPLDSELTHSQSSPITSVVSSHGDGLSRDIDWDEFSETVRSEVSASLRSVLQEYQLNGQSDPSFENIDVIELVHNHNGELVAKRLRLDLANEEKKNEDEEKKNEDEEKKNEDEEKKNEEKKDEDEEKKNRSNDHKTLSSTLEEARINSDQKSEIISILNENPHSRVTVDANGVVHVITDHVESPNTLSSTHHSYSDSGSTPVSDDLHSPPTPAHNEVHSRAVNAAQQAHDRIHAEALRRQQ